MRQEASLARRRYAARLSRCNVVMATLRIILRDVAIGSIPMV